MTVTDTNALDLQALTLTGNLNVTTTGPITDSGNLVIGGTTTVAAGAGNDVTLNTAGNNFTGAVSVGSGNNVTLVDAAGIDLGASTVSGNLAVTATTGNITNSGAVAVTGTSAFTVALLAANVLRRRPHLFGIFTRKQCEQRFLLTGVTR